MTGSLPALLARAARRNADKPAIVGDDVTLSYRELYECVESVAARLHAAGITAGMRVGLALERGPLSPVSSAALLRLGCAYVPLQIDQPTTRLRHIVEDAGLEWVLCDEAGARVAADLGLAPAMVGPDDLDAANRTAPVPDLAEPGPADPAYVIYTSGSTGRPKGVEVIHGNVLALLDDAMPLFSFGADDVCPMVHGDGFDPSVWEAWASIACGATLISVPQRVLVDPGQLLELLVRHRATRLHAVPSIFRQLAEVIVDSGLKVPLRYVALGGEQINYSAIESWMRSQTRPYPVWLNVYGTTETTVYNTLARLSEADIRDAPMPTPIGTAFAHSPVVVLDEELRPAAPGQTGEVFIGGAQVSRGYVGDSNLTAARFLSVPGRPGRWYRTGDLAFAQPDGSLRYIGRIDDQVKIRGYRIELGEIEHALRGLAWISDGAAVVHENSRGEAVLVVLVIPVNPADGADRAALAKRLRRDLAATLPAHMLPNRVFCVEQLPLNSNGKMDRRVLAEMVTRPQLV